MGRWSKAAQAMRERCIRSNGHGLHPLEKIAEPWAIHQVAALKIDAQGVIRAIDDKIQNLELQNLDDMTMDMHSRGRTVCTSFLVERTGEVEGYGKRKLKKSEEKSIPVLPLLQSAALWVMILNFYEIEKLVCTDDVYCITVLVCIVPLIWDMILNNLLLPIMMT
eukprot:Gb_36687 [translate_table: standard]